MDDPEPLPLPAGGLASKFWEEEGIQTDIATIRAAGPVCFVDGCYPMIIGFFSVCHSVPLTP